MTPALIFDLDGTLVDTAPDLLNALNVILAREGRAPIDPPEMRHLVGRGAGAMIAEAFTRTGEAADPVRLDGLLEAYLAEYRAHIADFSRPYPGVEETLAKLREGGARLGVLTNKPHEMATLLLSALGLDKYFEAVYGAGRVPYFKPDPRIFEDVLRDLGGPGAGALMVGDSITDVQTARGAGRPVILMSYGYTPEPAVSLGADAVLDDFKGVPAAAVRLLRPRYGIQVNAQAI